MDQPTAKNTQAKNMQQYQIQLKQKQEQLMQTLEAKRKVAKQVMEASIIEANTALAKLPEGSDQYKRLDDHIFNAHTAAASLHSAYQAISQLPLCCDKALLQKDMSTKIQVAGDVLNTLKQNRDDIKRARIAEHKMHEAVDAYKTSCRITAVRSKYWNKAFLFKAQPLPSSDNEDGGVEAESDEAEEADEAEAE
jgi:hypothetical protein